MIIVYLVQCGWRTRFCTNVIYTHCEICLHWSAARGRQHVIPSIFPNNLHSNRTWSCSQNHCNLDQHIIQTLEHWHIEFETMLNVYLGFETKTRPRLYLSKKNQTKQKIIYTLKTYFMETDRLQFPIFSLALGWWRNAILQKPLICFCAFWHLRLHLLVSSLLYWHLAKYCCHGWYIGYVNAVFVVKSALHAQTQYYSQNQIFGRVKWAKKTHSY